MPRLSSFVPVLVASTVGLAVVGGLLWVAPAGLSRGTMFCHLLVGAGALTGLGTLLVVAVGRLGRRPVPWVASAALIFSLVTPALGARAWLDVQALLEVLALDSDDISVPAPELGEGAHRLIPNLRDAQVVVAARPIDITEIDGFHLDQTVTRRKAFRVNTNSLGMRGTRELVTPAPGFRAVFVGSSITFGHGVDEPDTMVALLEERLGIEVVNAGVPGRRPGAAARWLAELAPVLDPDLLVLSESAPGEGVVADVLAIGAVYPGVPIAVLVPPTPKAHLPIEEMGHPQPPSVTAEALARAAPEVPLLDLTHRLLGYMQPPGNYLLFDHEGQYLVDLATGAIVASSPGTHHIVAPELTRALEADHSLHFPLYVDDAHPDEEGHRIMAQLVGDWLLEQGLVPATP